MQGPAPKPLARYALSLSPREQLVVDLDQPVGPTSGCGREERAVKDRRRGTGSAWLDTVAPIRVPDRLAATDKDRAAAMISSLFLHIHPARVSRHVLRPTYTFALGLISGHPVRGPRRSPAWP